MSWEEVSFSGASYVLTHQAAPMTCAGVTIFNAIKKAGLKPRGVLAISGLGALGHIGVQIAKAQVGTPLRLLLTMVRVCLSLASMHERDPLTSAHRSSSHQTSSSTPAK
jgi:hypothetical protein